MSLHFLLPVISCQRDLGQAIDVLVLKTRRSGQPKAYPLEAGETLRQRELNSSWILCSITAIVFPAQSPSIVGVNLGHVFSKKSVVYFSVVFFVENCDILDRNGIENRDGVGMSQVAVVVSPTARCGFPPLWAAVMRFWSKVHREGARSVGNWDDEQLPQRNAANPMETNSPSFSKWRWPLKWKADAFSRERLIFHHWNFFHQHVEWWSSDEPSPSHTGMWEVWNVTAGERRGGE